MRHGPPRAQTQTDRYVYVGPGGGIDDLQKRYSELILVTLRPHYDLVTLMGTLEAVLTAWGSISEVGIFRRGHRGGSR